MKKLLFTLCLLLGAMNVSAQSHQPSDRIAAYREAIGLDMTVPDFETKKIDTKLITICSTTGNYMWLKEQK